VLGGSLEEYGELRKKNTDAIQDMAEENFYEMRDATADPVFQRKRELETMLEQAYPDYFSKYSIYLSELIFISMVLVFLRTTTPSTTAVYILLFAS
jgi:hypothetical protein